MRRTTVFARTLAAGFGALVSLALGQPSPGSQAFDSSPAPRDIDLAALTLRDAADAVAFANRDMQAARAALDAARGLLISAGKRPNPTLTIGGGPGLMGQYSARDADLNANYSQTIERGNKANRDAFARALEAAQLRLKAGDIARTDVVRLRVEGGRSENEVQQARADLAIAREVLAALFAREREAGGIRAIDPWPPSGEAVPPRHRIDDLLEMRPDLRAAAARVRSAEASYELTKAQRTRDVNLAVVTDRNLPANGGTTLQFQVAIPLFINNDYGGDIVRTEAELKTARIELDKLRGSARSEAQRALEQFESMRSQLARFEGQIVPDA